MLAEFFRGFIRIHILHHAEKGPVYGLQMAGELGRHGYTSISPGTLYPTLHGLEQAGYLRAEARLIEGRWRKYYHITPAGRQALAQIRAKLSELAGEVLETNERISE
jgi:DNA-binding PadR family transcriptional regulator